MRRGAGFAAAGICAVLACAPFARAQSAPPIDPVSKLTLFAAAFAKDDVAPPPQKTTAMAFLPGRGVVAWDITGKTPEQAREAQIEAMGLADARAVQREIDEAAAQRQAESDREQAEQRAFAVESVEQRAGLNIPAITGAREEAGGIIPLNDAARRQNGGGLALRNGRQMSSRPRVYAFAAVSGHAVGLNVLHDETGWKNGGLTADDGGFTGQRQAGLAWRAGATQASLSYVRQKTEAHILVGMQTTKDDRVMLTMNMTPQALAGLIAKPH
jgi:hypothetical protein